VVAISIYWKMCWAKLKIGIGKGKKHYDKRSCIRKHEWNVEKSRIMKKVNR
jgi:SsrA-binding protein